MAGGLLPDTRHMVREIFESPTKTIPPVVSVRVFRSQLQSKVCTSLRVKTCRKAFSFSGPRTLNEYLYQCVPVILLVTNLGVIIKVVIVAVK